MKQNVNRVCGGFLLIELLVALFMIGTLSIMVSGIYIGIMNLQRKALDVVTAVELVSYYANSNTIADIITAGELKKGKFTLQASIAKDTKLSGFSWVTISISWPDKPSRDKFTTLTFTRGLML